MQLIDTHSHLYLPHFEKDIDEVIQRCRESDVTRIFLPNIDMESTESLLSLCDREPEMFFPMMGLHPCSVKADYERQLEELAAIAGRQKIYAIGEIGLDYYWDLTFKAEQQDAFRRQIDWAKQMDLPIVIHSRDSFPDVLDILTECNDDKLRGICHCFTGTADEGRRAIDLGFYLGIGGVVTFKNGGLDKVLPDLPLASLVLETDSPYLSPVPYRGKRNESAYTRLVAQKIAEVMGIDLEEVAGVTTTNASRVFGVPL